MERTLIFEQVFMDALLLEAGKTEYSFFSNNADQEESVTSMMEERAIQWLFQHGEFKRMFLGKFFEDPSKIKCFFNTVHPFTRSNNIPGDLDILLVDPDVPQKIFSFECKRVKATSVNATHSKVNGAENIKRGIKQANGYQSLGFHQSYLVVILLDDARRLETPNKMLSYGKSEAVMQVFDIPLNEPLHDDVGVMYIRISQPTGKSINYSVGIGLCLDKVAKSLEQPMALTNKVIELLKSY